MFLTRLSLLSCCYRNCDINYTQQQVITVLVLLLLLHQLYTTTGYYCAAVAITTSAIHNKSLLCCCYWLLSHQLHTATNKTHDESQDDWSSNKARSLTELKTDGGVVVSTAVVFGTAGLATELWLIEWFSPVDTAVVFSL